MGWAKVVIDATSGPATDSMLSQLALGPSEKLCGNLGGGDLLGAL